MKAAQLKEYGGKDSVIINPNTPIPGIVPETVRVKVIVAGLNPFQWKLREGQAKSYLPLKLPATLGTDFAGTIEEVAGDVSDFKPGDDVYGQSSLMQGGALAEFAIAKKDAIAPKPEKLSFAEAAALPLVGCSAWEALSETIQLNSGQSVLIHGGAGGIGSIAIQLAKHLGAYVVTTVSSDDIQYAKSLGVDEVIDYKSEDFEDKVSNMDAVFDTVGGEVYKKSFEVLKPGGIIVSMLEQPNKELEEKYQVKAVYESAKVTRERLEKLTELVDQGILTIHIDKTFPLSEAPEALEYQKTGHPRGKVVVDVKH